MGSHHLDPPPALRLTKHHGLGNDFLVLLGTAAEVAGVGAAEARRWCARHTGIGADGLLVGVTDHPDHDLVMTLHNADGSVAEMSGNGIRCLAHAEALRRGEALLELAVLTGGGPRTVVVRPGPAEDPHLVEATVAMGPAAPGPEPDRGHLSGLPVPGVQRQAVVDLGNPHLVLLVEDPDALPIDVVGAACEGGWSSGINVHLVSPTPGEADALTQRVWERGVGVTQACGTGAVAAAAAAHSWGLVGEAVTVHMLGGDVQVGIADGGARTTLTGPAAYVATVEVPRA